MASKRLVPETLKALGLDKIETQETSSQETSSPMPELSSVQYVAPFVQELELPSVTANQSVGDELPPMPAAVPPHESPLPSLDSFNTQPAPSLPEPPDMRGTESLADATTETTFGATVMPPEPNDITTTSPTSREPLHGDAPQPTVAPRDTQTSTAPRTRPPQASTTPDREWVERTMSPQIPELPESPRYSSPGHGSFTFDDPLGDEKNARERASSEMGARRVIEEMQEMQDDVHRFQNSTNSLTFEMLRQLAVDSNNDDRRLRELNSAFQHSRTTLYDVNI